jgi:hypothetical protein
VRKCLVWKTVSLIVAFDERFFLLVLHKYIIE